MWNCPRCGEKVDASFDMCWACGTSKEGVPDPHFFDEEEEEAPELAAYEGAVDEIDAPLITVASYPFAYQAHAVKVMLESEEIPVVLADELTVTMDWLLANAVGGIKLQVREQDAERALAIIAAKEQPVHDDEAENPEE